MVELELALSGANMTAGRYQRLGILLVLTIVGASHSFADSAGLCRSDIASATALPACDELIASKRITGSDLSGAFLVRSHIWHGRNETDREFADLEDALRIDPKNFPARMARAAILRQRKSFDLARADIDAVIASEPRNAKAFFQSAFLAASQSDYDRAIADYTTSLEIDHDQAWAYNNRGFALRERGRNDAALNDFDAALKISSNNQNAHVGKGRCLSDKKDYAGAIAEFTTAIALNPHYTDAFFQRAFTAAKAGNQPDALVDYTEALRLNPKSIFAYANRANIKRGLGDIDGAIADLTEAITIDPAFSGALARRGLAFESKNDLERAKEDFKAVLSLPPKYDTGRWALKTARTRLATLSAPVTKSSEPDLFAKPAALPEKVALVIGNGAYLHVPALPNPAADARAIAGSLRDLGFNVVDGTDLGHREMEDRIVSFLRRVPSAKIAMIFYAGHGVQIEGRNYLVPVDANKITRSTLAFELIDVDRILAGLDDESRANIVILDACRDNPLESKSVSRSTAERGGLAAYSDVASGMLVAFATAPGKTANDGSGTNSPFTTAFLKNVKHPVEINEMLRQVRVDVFSATNKQQLPWANSSLLGQVYLSRSADKKPD